MPGVQLVACSLALTASSACVCVCILCSLCVKGAPYSLVCAASLALNHRTRRYTRMHAQKHTHHPLLSFCPGYVVCEKAQNKKTEAEKHVKVDGRALRAKDK